MMSPSEMKILFISPLQATSVSGITSWTQRVVKQGLPDSRVYVVDTGILRHVFGVPHSIATRSGMANIHEVIRCEGGNEKLPMKLL